MRKRILFYSSVASKKQFVAQEYYRTDIRILRDLGFDVYLSKNWTDFLAFWRYDTAFIYFYRYGLIPAMLARLTGKHVYFTGGIDYLDKQMATRKEHRVQAIFYNLCGFFASRNIIVSEADLRNCERIRYLFPASRQVVCKHSIGESYLDNSGEAGKEKLVVTIAWMGRTENVVRKGLIEAMDFFAELRRGDPAWRMVIIGPTGQGTPMVLSHIDGCGLLDSVELAGRVPEAEKISLLRRASVYLQLSRYEGFGIAAIEALACRCLVVHSGAGGLSEGVGERGLLWSQASQSTALSSLLALLADGDRRAHWMAEGQRHVEALYSMNRRRSGFAAIVR